MADDGEDDYLSDKFLVEIASKEKPKTYSDKRKEALKRAQLRNEQNRMKSRRQRELEAREEGLAKSLFERAEEAGPSGGQPQSKALAMMMKMGFKPGQSLGRVEEPAVDTTPPPAPRSPSGTPAAESSSDADILLSKAEREARAQHRVEPLPISEWAGKKGIGLGKRAASPTDLEQLAKLAKVEEQTSQESFRDRARREFEQRRAEGRLAPAQATCVTLDEKAGVSFNVLWLNPLKAESLPEGLLDALAEYSVTISDAALHEDPSVQGRLRAQMRADALQPLAAELEDEGAPLTEKVIQETPFSPEIVGEAAKFLRLSPQDRLEQVLQYLRRNFHYCFWCGTHYGSAAELEEQCPGPDEDAHD